jgi:hypothetical protein
VITVGLGSREGEAGRRLSFGGDSGRVLEAAGTRLFCLSLLSLSGLLTGLGAEAGVAGDGGTIRMLRL